MSLRESYEERRAGVESLQNIQEINKTLKAMHEDFHELLDLLKSVRPVTTQDLRSTIACRIAERKPTLG